MGILRYKETQLPRVATRWSTVLHIDCENGISEIKRRCDFSASVLPPDCCFVSRDPKLGPPPQLPIQFTSSSQKKGWGPRFRPRWRFKPAASDQSGRHCPRSSSNSSDWGKNWVPIIAIHHSSDKDDRNPTWLYVHTSLAGCGLFRRNHQRPDRR